MMQIGMIDTLEISYDILDYGKKLKGFLDELETKKTISEELRKEGNKTVVTVEIDNIHYEVKPNGSANHAYILHSDDYELKFAKFRALSTNFYPIAVKIKSKCLWSESPEKACEYLKEILKLLSNKYNSEKDSIEIIERVKRVDLCCHTDKFYLDKSKLNEFSSKCNKKVTYENNDNIETHAFGVRSNPVYCRIYDKTAEVMNNINKQWFYDIWRRLNFNVGKVWNVEFEIKRELLNENNINTTENLFSNIKSLWIYCTDNWLRHLELNKIRKDRCEASKEWKEIQQAFNLYKGESYITRQKQNEVNADSLIPIISGYLTTYASKFKEMTAEKAWEDIFFKGSLYLNHKETDYKTVIDKKRLLRKGIN